METADKPTFQFDLFRGMDEERGEVIEISKEIAQLKVNQWRNHTFLKYIKPRLQVGVELPHGRGFINNAGPISCWLAATS